MASILDSIAEDTVVSLAMVPWPRCVSKLRAQSVACWRHCLISFWLRLVLCVHIQGTVLCPPRSLF